MSNYFDLIPKLKTLSNRDLKPELVFEGQEFKYDHILSQSQLGKFKDCPLDWAYSYLLKLPATDTIYPGTIAGEVWHKMFEDYIQSGQKMSTSELNKIFVLESDRKLKEYRKSGKNIYYSFGDYISKTTDECIALTNYLASKPALSGYTKYMTEVPLLYKYRDDIWLRGYIDVVAFNKDGSVDLWDWKTTKKWKERTPETDLQMQIFVIAFEELTGLKVKNFNYWIFSKSPIDFKTQEFAVDRSLLDHHLSEFVDKFELAYSSMDIKPVSESQNADACTFCKYKGAACKNYEKELASFSSKRIKAQR